jgi:hypothetical protein
MLEQSILRSERLGKFFGTMNQSIGDLKKIDDMKSGLRDRENFEDMKYDPRLLTRV